MAFFTLDTTLVDRGDEHEQATKREHNCLTCGLFRHCETPKFKAHGEGRKKILIIGDLLTRSYDQSNGERPGQIYLFLEAQLKAQGIDLHRDCWYTPAIKCYTKDPTPANISACNRMLIEEMRQLKPHIIVPTSSHAWSVLLWQRMQGRAQSASFFDYSGEVIPDQDFKAWITPIFAPKMVLEAQEKRGNRFFPIFQEQIANILTLVNADVPRFEYEDRARVITRLDDACAVLEEAFAWPKVAFDYETTSIKPYKKKNKIVAMSISNGEISYAFPYFEDAEFRALAGRLFRNKAVKIAHNSSFERSWTLNKFGTKVNNLSEDPMLMLHSKNNWKPANLKFGTYANFGILGYDGDIDEFIKSNPDDVRIEKSHATNRMAQAPLRKMLKYCALDSLFTFWLQEKLEKELHPVHQLPGYRFFMRAQWALDKAHENGMRVDIEAMDQVEPVIRAKMERAYDVVTHHETILQLWDWDQAFNPKSDPHVRHFVYDIMKAEPFEFTERDQPSVDEDTLQKLKHLIPIIEPLLEFRRWYKVVDTYFAQFRGEAVEGWIYPNYNLFGVRTYRSSSCIRKGTPIMVNRGYGPEDNRKGVPIEDVRAGDMVFCFDDNLKPVLRRVLWAGKTGHREVVRIHYQGHGGRRGHLDVTPEHRIRMTNGEYVEAWDLLKQDSRDKNDPSWKYQPKCRVLSMHRDTGSKLDRVWHTGGEFLEHRFVHEQLTGEAIGAGFDVHHKDHDHTNHEFSNLEVKSDADHARDHYNEGTGIATPGAQARGLAKIAEMRKDGLITVPSGMDNKTYKALSVFECLYALAANRGKLAKGRYDFTRLKRECARHDIDVASIALRYNYRGEYLSRNKVLSAIRTHGLSAAQKILGVGYYPLRNLMTQYGIGYDRAWGNQNGFRKDAVITENNHVILDVEWIGEVDDVYDLHIEDYHNFIADEICVHNSAPNFQNIPKRDKEIKKLLRSLLFARRGHKIIEYDFKSMEVCIAAAVTGDPNLIKYVSDLSTDMHLDSSVTLFMLPKEKVNKALRNVTKNGFVFASFYGSYWAQTSLDIWDQISVKDPEKVFGLDVIAHLREQGIESMEDWQRHVEEQEHILWHDRFPDYQKFRENLFALFQRQGYIDYPNGFRYYGPSGKNQVLNSPVQGPAFHTQLWAFTEITEYLEREKFDSRFMGQIHDAMVGDVLPAEEEWMDRLVIEYATKKVKEFWPWITVPLVVEKEASPVDGSWAEMEAFGYLKEAS